MSATNHTNDFFRLIDLNPPAPFGPVTDPRDPRGQCWFGFVSQSQRLSIEFNTNPPPPGLRVIYSFDYEYNSGAGIVAPPAAKPHGILQMGSPGDQDQTYVELHDRTFVCLWIDPTGPQPTPGSSVQVTVKAWRQD